MNSKQFNLNIDLLYPYISFDKYEFIFRKIIDLNEIEAIILSFIYLNENETTNFMTTFKAKFNLENKWDGFIYDVIKNMRSANVLTIEQNLDEYTLCSDFKINDEVKIYLEKNKFKGLDDKKITKRWTLHKSIYHDIVDPWIIDSKHTAQLNLNLDYSLFLKGNYLVEVKDKINDLLRDDNLAIVKIDNEDEKTICYHQYKTPIQFNIDNDTLIITSSDKKAYDYIAWLLEQDLTPILIETFKMLTNNSVAQLKDIVDYSYVSIDTYEQTLKKLDELAFYKSKQYLFIESNKVLVLRNKVHNISILSEDHKTSEQLNLLVQYEYKQLDEFILDLIKEEYYEEAINLLEQYKINSKSINDYIVKQEFFLTNNQFIKYKNYILKNILIDNSLDERIFCLLINSNNIDINDLNHVLNSNESSIKNIMLKNTIEFHNDVLINNKLVNLLIKLKLNPKDLALKTIVKDQYISFSKKLEELSKDKGVTILEIKQNLEILKQNISDFYKPNKVLEWFKDQITKVETLIEHRSKEDLEKFKSKILDLTHILDDIKASIKKKTQNWAEIEELIYDSNYREKFKTIRSFRNHYNHGDPKCKLPNINETEEIIKLNKQADEYLDWLNKNKENIIKLVDNHNNEKGE